MIDVDRLPTLETPRIRLRELAEGDIDALFALFTDPQMMRYWSRTAMTERDEAVAHLAQVRAHHAGKSAFEWGIERREDARLLGTCTLFHLDRQNMRAEIGFCLRSDFWKQGFMSEALAALFGFAFGTLKLRRLEADVDPNNENSLRILARLGFRQEGLLRERWSVGGGIQDTAFLGLLAREWQAERVA